MPAYLIHTQLEETDPALMAEYRAKVYETVAAYGGQNLVADPNFEVIEGTWDGDLAVVSRFPDMASLEGWYESDAYKPLREMRPRAARGNLIFAEGS